MILFISRELGGKNFVTTQGGTKTFPFNYYFFIVEIKYFLQKNVFIAMKISN